MVSGLWFDRDSPRKYGQIADEQSILERYQDALYVLFAVDYQLVVGTYLHAIDTATDSLQPARTVRKKFGT
jgi:hypothetical protein